MKKNIISQGILKKIGSRIKSIRIKLNLNQSDYAKKLKVSQSFLSFVETGRRKPSFDLFLSLLLYCQVNLQWIITGKGEMLIRDEDGGRITQDKPKFADIFPGVPPESDVINLVKSLEVPIMRNALVEKYLLYRKRYEAFILEYYREKPANLHGREVRANDSIGK